MLIGEFESKVTDKNRVAIPKKFREELGAKLVVMQGYEGCMILVDEEKFLALTKDITNGKFINDAVRDTTRFLIGSAHEIGLDKQGRFILPQSLKSFSQIEDEVVFLGLLNWIEVWDKNKWLQRKNVISSNSSEIAQRLDSGFSNATNT
jgi:MraZ protein